MKRKTIIGTTVTALLSGSLLAGCYLFKESKPPLDQLAEYGPIDAKQIKYYGKIGGKRTFYVPKKSPEKSSKNLQAKNSNSMTLSLKSTKQTSFVRGFRGNLETVAANWDSYSQQMEFVNDFYLSAGLSEDWGGAATSKGDIFYFKNESGSGLLVHELAHIWHQNLSDEIGFNQKWSTISGNWYSGEEWEEATREEIARIGGVRDYSTRNLNEDVASTVQFVYSLTFPNCSITGLMESPPLGAPFRSGFGLNPHDLSQTSNCALRGPKSTRKVMRKVQLLEDYGFISEREEKYVLEKLEGSLE